MDRFVESEPEMPGIILRLRSLDTDEESDGSIRRNIGVDENDGLVHWAAGFLSCYARDFFITRTRIATNEGPIAPLPRSYSLGGRRSGTKRGLPPYDEGASEATGPSLSSAEAVPPSSCPFRAAIHCFISSFVGKRPFCF